MPPCTPQQNTVADETSPMHNRIDRRLAITREAQAQILELYAGGIETRSLAERFGVQENYIRKLASRHGVRKGRCAYDPPPQLKPRKPAVRNGHIAAYKAARRGFAVPPDLEPEYTKLLIGGCSRREAAKRLGLLPADRQRPAVVRLDREPRPCLS